MISDAAFLYGVVSSISKALSWCYHHCTVVVVLHAIVCFDVQSVWECFNKHEVYGGEKKRRTRGRRRCVYYTEFCASWMKYILSQSKHKTTFWLTIFLCPENISASTPLLKFQSFTKFQNSQPAFWLDKTPHFFETYFTTGASARCEKMVAWFKYCKINIPLNQNTENLNFVYFILTLHYFCSFYFSQILSLSIEMYK